MPQPVDIAIIGGGVIGCAIAWRLAQSGASCALVDRGRFGNGASGATAGIIAPLWHIPPDNPPLFQMGIRSLDLFPQWAAQLADHGINPEFQQTGVLKIALTPSDAEALAQSYQWQSQLNLGVQWLQPDDLRQREPQANPEAIAAVFSPQEGCIRGQRLTNALAHAAARHGAALYENTEVTTLRQTANRVTGIETTAGPIPAGQTILAAGPWSGPAGPWSNAPLNLPIRGVKGQRILLRQPGFLPRSAPTTSPAT